MDILYTLGNGSIYNNEEIKQSIRLLKKHCKYDRIFIIGENPNIECTIHIPFKEFLHREDNVFLKICTMCEKDISENFLYMMDDVFILKDIDLDNYPLYYSQDIPNYDKPTSYQMKIIETKTFLLRNSKPFLHYGVHCPIVYNKSKIKELDPLYWYYVNGKLSRNGLNPRILYGNWFEHSNKKQINDLKITKDMPMEELKELLKDKEWFSIGSRSFEGNIRKFVEEQ